MDNKRRPTRRDTGRDLAIKAAQIAQDTNCLDIVILDLRRISPVADYFVICTGSSGRQMRATADQISEFGRSVGQKVWHIEGMDSGMWIVLDFVDVVVHVFDQQHREYYDLELIWGEAANVRWQRRNLAQQTGRGELGEGES